MKRILSLTLIFFSLPVLMFAHGSHGSGFIAGFTHPILGLDHSLAILGIGTLSYFLETKRWYLYPFAFLIMMIAGGVLGIGNEATLIIEKIIALSVFVIGLCHLKGRGAGSILLIGLMAVFGFFHGYAHGAEMPVTTTGLKYISGYSVGTILLSGVGFLISKKLLLVDNPNSHFKLISGFLMGAGFVFFWA